MYPVVRPSKLEGAAPFLEQDTMFLLAVSGPEESGWDLLEERVSFGSLHFGSAEIDHTSEGEALGRASRSHLFRLQ